MFGSNKVLTVCNIWLLRCLPWSYVDMLVLFVLEHCAEHGFESSKMAWLNLSFQTQNGTLENQVLFETGTLVSLKCF